MAEQNKPTGKPVAKVEVKPVAKPPKDVQSESSKMEQENERRDAMVRKEREAYDAGEKTRLKEQGSFFKKGGKVSSASKRADGCAIRGKTRA